MKSKQRLGRGLDALIPQVPDNEDKSRLESLSQIEVSRISVNPMQPRMEFDAARMAELKQSIEQNGIIQPITIREKGQGFELISGERRLRAVMELGYERIPAYIMAVDSEDRLLELALIENIQREDLNPIEVSRAYQRLQQEYGLTQEEVAKKVGKDRATVSNFIRLLKLPAVIQDALLREELSMGHAKAVGALSSPGQQIRLARKCIQQGWSVRKLEDEVRRLAEGRPAQKFSKKEAKHPGVAALEDRLRTKLGTQVRIFPSGKGGRIEIAYFSAEDLERLTDMMESIKD
ncbi:ParB/RepB/Spo0J family partition protein [bacterium]|nr:ParB/RepB/Spo0J family partition protein [bacterium]